MARLRFWKIVSFLLLCALQANARTEGNISLKKSWLFKGDGLTQTDRFVDIRVQLPLAQDEFAIQIGDKEPILLTRKSRQPQAIRINVSSLAVGSYSIRVTQNNSEIAQTTLHISYPLYVIVSTDWDNTRTSDQVLGWVDALHSQFPDMKYTHFFAPYHYTDPEISEARRIEIDAYVKRHRDEYGDEIGLHIHGWCHFINTTGVPCRTRESFYRDDGTGYTTILAAYSTEELSKIFAASVQMFKINGLGIPTSFRAGGWTTDAKVLEALIENGFQVESSAVPAHRLSSWQGYTLYDWNMSNWIGINETSQPYFPNRDHITMGGAPAFPILEVPDNGVLVDYVSGQDMIDIYNLNHPGGLPLAQSRVFQIGLHPVNSFQYYRFQRMVQALSHVENHSYKKDLGPAVYVTLSDLTKVFRAQ